MHISGCLAHQHRLLLSFRYLDHFWKVVRILPPRKIFSPLNFLRVVTVLNTILKDPFKEVGTDHREGESLRDIPYLGWSVFHLYELLLQGPHPDSGRP